MNVAIINFECGAWMKLFLEAMKQNTSKEALYFEELSPKKINLFIDFRKVRKEDFEVLFSQCKRFSLDLSF